MMTFDPPTGSGGIEGRTMQYTSRLLERSIHVEVVALSPNIKMSVEPYRGTRLIRLPSSPLRLPKAFAALVKLMSGSSLDTVFMLSGASTPMGILVLCFSRFTGRKSGVFFYGRDILQMTKSETGRVSLLLSVHLAGGVATNSRQTANLLPYRPRSTLTVVYPGVDPGITKRVAAERDPLSPRILFVGRLVPRKGADLLLSSFQRLRQRFPALRLDIVGEGPEAGGLRALAERNSLGDSVTFHGALYGEELWEKYARASLFVMPSRNSADDIEGFGTVFLEAGVFGVPSVGTKVGGIPEAIVDGVTGRLVESDNVDQLTAAIQDLLGKPAEIERMGINARRRALEFSWNASTDELLHALGRSS